LKEKEEEKDRKEFVGYDGDDTRAADMCVGDVKDRDKWSGTRVADLK